MEVEYLNIDGALVPHSVVPITGDGACLFRAVSYVLFDNESYADVIRNSIVRLVVGQWSSFVNDTCNSNGESYSNPVDYENDMIKPHTFGSYAELTAAGKLYPIYIEVYFNQTLIAVAGTEGSTIKRFRFSGNLSGGHYDVYKPIETFNDRSSLT
ncbi:hypothetical protein KR084_001947, partial [Drosophila pseudotakahashii]